MQVAVSHLSIEAPPRAIDLASGLRKSGGDAYRFFRESLKQGPLKVSRNGFAVKALDQQQTIPCGQGTQTLEQLQIVAVITGHSERAVHYHNRAKRTVTLQPRENVRKIPEDEGGPIADSVATRAGDLFEEKLETDHNLRLRTHDSPDRLSGDRFRKRGRVLFVRL